MRGFAWMVAIICLSSSVAVGSANAADRFFLFMVDEPAPATIVQAAFRETSQPKPHAIAPLSPAVARERLGNVFPRLFKNSRSVDRAALEGDLKAARGAHFNGQFQDSESVFARALDAVKDEPEILADAKLFQRLVDGAATRYKNTLARRRPKAEARAQIEAFLMRYPMASPTVSDHAPEVVSAWNEVRNAIKDGFGALRVNVHPLELERGGGCKLFINGAEVADLPQPGSFAVPRGEHLIQVRCGPQLGWLQRINIGAAPLAVRVPVRAMLSGRGDSSSGGVVLVAPAVGDASALIDALSAACDLDGAVVAVAASDKVKFGQWLVASDDPALDQVGKIEGDAIADVRKLSQSKPDSGGGGRVWTWVVGGVGLAALGGGVVANVMAADKINAGEDAEGLKTATVALYIAGGALVATSIILFFVEGSGDDESGSASFIPGPGSMTVRF